ncbi:hypothetical protein CFP56_037811 [Quercus suber]|uniref:Glycosyltransferase 61 catalytic domain-containing protein n=1 Tax=Quercus suber TaxID=58331 RepID=A0AAW0J4E7_QUESU
MMYDDLLAKSFSKHEKKKLAYGAFFGCFLIALSFCTLSMAAGFEKLMKMEPLCDVTERRGDICNIDGDVRIQGNSSSVFLVSSEMSFLSGNNNSWNIRPYARKDNPAAMNPIKEWSVKLSRRDEISPCKKNQSVPAILFSQGGYTGNHFHDFSDVVIPLYLTSRQYYGEVQFLITDKRPWWIAKFKAILKNLSRYELMDIDREQEVHCFPSVIVGLKRNVKELSIDPSKYSYSMSDFREFLRSCYSLKRVNAIKVRDDQHKMPHLLIISRKRTRSFTNIGEITKMASSLGYNVTVAEPTMNVSKFAELVNSCDVLMGVHGAGLTNIVFLPKNAILIQIVPFGDFEWLARTDYGEPTKDMNVKYLEYKISTEERTLVQQYPPDHVVFKDPHSIQKQGFVAFKSVYMDKQNVKLDVNRFRPTLLKALELLHQ